MNDFVGVIGGLGPLATSYFMNLVINNTKAKKDQEHINMVVLNHATVPDRTDFIIGRSFDNPANDLIKDAKLLEQIGCKFLVMPCNTAQFFYDKIVKNVNIEFLSIVDCTVDSIPKNSKVGIMATDGTLLAKIYQNILDLRGTEWFEPEHKVQNEIMNLIYNYVKKGITVPKEKFMSIIDYFFLNGCDYVIVGCTELSVIYTDLKIKDKRVIDSLTCLARETIKKCGKELNNE